MGRGTNFGVIKMSGEENEVRKKVSDLLMWG
jgi:hypothetical protein